MSDLITDAMVEAAAKAFANHEYRINGRAGRIASAAIVYAEWWWTCDECGDYALEPYDTRTEAERAADAHECKAKP